MNLRRRCAAGSRAGPSWAAALLVLTLAGCATTTPRDAFEAQRLLGRGVNLGNMLEAPREGDWGLYAQDDYLRLIREAGFQSVRIPVRWSAHAGEEAPYALDAGFLERVDHVVRVALAQQLVVVLNLHHYEELMDRPAAHRARFLALWDQLARHYRDWPARLYLEPCNEPHGALDDQAWSALAADALRTIRAADPRRIVVLGPANWNTAIHLPYLTLPEEDRRIVVTFHYYEPFAFTHQGAPWVRGADAWKGTAWSGTREETARIGRDLDRAAAWADAQRRPLYCGEFGAYREGDPDSRERWTYFVARALEERGIAWAYWEFGSGFGIYDPDAGQWRAPLRDALLP